MALLSVPVIRNVAKPRMSTYSLELLAVAIVSVIGTSRVTGCPAEFVPVTRSVSEYTPGPRVPPLTETVTFWLVPLLRVTVDGLTLTVPIPAGRTPFEFAPPSTLRLTSPPKKVPLLLVVLTVTGAVPVEPVDASEIVAPELVEKSRLTLPMAMPTG
jgi:hypothetical protein